MSRIGKKTDLSANKPGYRANIRSPQAAIGTHRLLPRLRTFRRRPVPVEREIDLTTLSGGEPSPRANVDQLVIDARMQSGGREIG
jgi:hypothetical protein